MPKPRRVPLHVRKAIEGANIQIPQIAELVSHFMALSGGPQALAKMIFEEYINSRPGSIIRQRLLDAILRMMSSAQQEVGYSEEIDLIATEDLKAELDKMIEEASEESSNGKEETT